MYAPELLGVANISPDSTTKVSVAATTDELRTRAECLRAAGASYIDIGARSTWEFAALISEQEECDLLLKGLEILKREGHRVSVDTWGSQTAIEALRNGAPMLNYTGQDYPPALLQALKETDAKVIVTYIPFGDPYLMREAAIHNPTLESIRQYFENILLEMNRYQLTQIILDPNTGILHHGLSDREKLVIQARIVSGLPKLRSLGFPLLVHSSRQADANSRSIIAAYVISQKPEYIRTHYPELLKELIGYANQV